MKFLKFIYFFHPKLNKFLVFSKNSLNIIFTIIIRRGKAIEIIVDVRYQGKKSGNAQKKSYKNSFR